MRRRETHHREEIHVRCGTGNEPCDVLPFLKWAGGKRWLTPTLIPVLPEYERYIEPFLGGASVFFAARPRAAILSDANADLIATYEVVRDDPDELQASLRAHQKRHSGEHYGKMRAYNPRKKLNVASRFLYLNRACWNGLYRVNRNGQFNVPKGTKNSVILASDDFHCVSQLLKRAALRCTDFEAVIDAAREGDFIFVDPPYALPSDEHFRKYNAQQFTWEDQRRLAATVARAVSRGAHVAATNANHRQVRDLYRAVGSLRRASRLNVIGGNGAIRGRRNELLVTTWEWSDSMSAERLV